MVGVFLQGVVALRGNGPIVMAMEMAKVAGIVGRPCERIHEPEYNYHAFKQGDAVYREFRFRSGAYSSSL